MKNILCSLLLLLAVPAWTWEISGVPEEIETNLNGLLEAEAENCSVDVSATTLFSDSLLMRMQEAIKPFGYYGAEIIVLDDEKALSCRELTYQIKLNEATTIKQVVVDLKDAGSKDAVLSELVADFPLKESAILRTPEYEQFKSQLRSQSHALGYLDGQFTRSQIKVNRETHQAEVLLTFDTGPLYHFSNIAVKQSEHFMDEVFLSNMLTIKPGDPVLNQVIAQQITVLNESLYFSSVTPKKMNKSAEDATVDLQINVSPADRIKYSVGLGFATDTGARTTLEYQNDRIGSKAYQFKSQAKIAETNQNLSMRLKIPSRSKPLKKWYAIDAGYLFEDIEDKEQNSKKLSFSQSRIYGEQWQNTNFIDITDIDFGFNGEPKRSAFLLVPGVSWSLRKADDWVYARQGFSVQATLQAASESLVSDVTFVQTDIKTKWIHPLGQNNRMIYRGQLGATAVDDLQQLPFSYRFYAGGDRNIRGFDFEGLSPVDNNNNLIGGKHLVALSAEFEHKWAEQWAWAVFSDAGNAFTDELDWKKSVGVGVRWFSPLGPVRLDLAHALDDDKGDGLKIHFTIGPDF